MKRAWTILWAVTTLLVILSAAASYASPPGVTINQWVGQPDPINTGPIKFRVVFDQPVTDFATGDVTITGSAPGTKTAAVTEVLPFNGTTYDVLVSGMTGSGTVIASVPAGRAHNAGGDPNTAATFTDNTVTYDITSPTASISLSTAQNNPTNATSVSFDIVFSEPVSLVQKKVDPDGKPDGGDNGQGGKYPNDDYFAVDVAKVVGITGTASGAVSKIDLTGSSNRYQATLTLDPTALTSPKVGTIIATVLAGAGTDQAGNGSLVSTGLDNTIVVDYEPPLVTVNQASGQPDPTNASPILFTAVFTEPVVDMKASAVTLTGAPTTTVTEAAPFDGTTYTIAASGMASSGAVTATIAENKVHDIAGNPNSASTSVDNSVTYKANARSVTVGKTKAGDFTGSVDQPDPTKNSPINFTVTFSGTVNGFTNSSVTIGGTAGATTAVVTNPSSDKRTFKVAVSGMVKTGTVSVSILADKTTEGNLPSTGSDNVVVYDNVAPTETISRAPTQASLTSSKPVTFRVVFSEAVFGFTGSAVTVAGTAPGTKTASVSEISPFDGTTYDIAVTGMSGSGSVIASVGANVVTDAAGNNNTASGTATLTYDVDSPTVIVSQAAAQVDPTNVSPVNFTVTFSEPVNGFTSTSVQIAGTAGATTATVSGIGAVYNVAVSGMAQSGTVILTVAAGGAQDGAGNGNLPSTSADNSITYDATAPTVTVNQADTQPDPVRNGPINFTVTFSEPVVGFVNSDVTVSGNAGATTAVVSDSGDHRIYNIAVDGMTQSGSVIVSLAAGVAQDFAGNLNRASTSTDNTVTYFSGPTVTVDQSASQIDPTSGKPVNFTVVFSEPVTGFTASDVVVSGSCAGTKTVTVTGAGANYNVAVDGMTSTGTVIVTVPAGAAQNSIAQGNLASTSTDNVVTYDITRPTVTIDQAAGQDDPTNTGPIRFIVVFSEPVTGFVGTDIVVRGTAGANAAAVTNTGDNKTYTVAVTGMTTSGTVILTIPANIAQDGVGNGNFQATSTDNTVDYEQNPSVTVVQAVGQSDPTVTGPIRFTATFSKPVSDFSSDDVTITGTATFGTTGVTVTNSGDDMIYGISVTGMNSSGTVIASLGAGVAHDDHGFPNTASTGADNTVTFQPVPPSVTINQATGQADPTNLNTVNFTAVFSAPVTGFSASGVAVTGNAGGTKTVTVTGSGATYNVAVSGMTSSGSIRVTIPAGVATDAVGNGNLASTSTDNTITYDIVAPTVTVNQAATQADPASSQPIHFTAVFSEAMTGFSATGVAIGGTAGATTAVVTQIAPNNGTTYDIAVSGATTSGTVTAGVIAGAAKDAAGNDNTVSTSTDGSVTLPLTVTIDKSVGQADPTNASTISFTAVFSEAVTGFGNASGDVLLSGTAGATTAEITAVDARTYTIAVSGMTTDGTVIATIPAAAAANSSAEPNVASTSTDNSVLYDATAPTVTVAKAVTQVDPTNATTINFTATFSEPVIGFASADVEVGGDAGATTAVVTATGPTTYRIAVTGMTTAGAVTVDIPAAVAKDAAGNDNEASDTASVTFNNLVLRVTVDQAAGQADPTNTSPINYTVVFSSTVSDFATGDVTLAGTAGATTAVVTGSGTSYNVAVSGMTQSGTVIASIAAGRAHDSANNPNIASQSTDNTVTYDTTRPTVAVAKAAGQADPASSSPINFTVTFGEIVTDFIDADVTLGGTAAPTTAVVTDSGDHRNYNVAVSGMPHAGTVTVALAAGVVHDAAGNANLASSAASVSFDRTGPTVTIALASGQTDPTRAATINFQVDFSASVSDFTSSDVQVTGTAGGTKTATVTGSGTSYNVAVTGATSTGTVIVTIPAGAAHNGSGDENTSATKTLVFDNQGPALAITGPTTDAATTRNTSAVTISGTSSDSQGIASVTWSSLHSGSGTCTGTTAWSADITIVGTQDTITVTSADTVGNQSTAEITIHVVSASPGAAWSGLAMVSLPIIPDDTDPKVEVGFTGNNWASFNPDANSYSSYPDAATWFTPASSAIGRGFWAKFTGAVATPTGTVPDQTVEASIHLRPGWNLVGTPFISQITWNSTAIQVEAGGVRRSLSAAGDSVRNFAWGWNSTTSAYYLVTDQAGTSGATTTLRPWEGYWIKAIANCNLIIPAP